MYFQQEEEIKSAISEDGKIFAVEEGTRLQGNMPAIVKLPDGSWRMYFQALEKGVAVLKSAVSSDTLNWDIEKGDRISAGGEFDPDGVAHPTVIPLPQGGFRMYYDGELKKTEQDFVRRILSATSEDGLIWTKDEGVRINVEEEPLNANLVFSSYATYDDLTETYELYFAVQSSEVKDGIYLATSKDGLLFNIVENTQLAPAKDGEQVGPYQDPFILGLETGKRMYYTALGSGIYSAVLTEAEEQEEREPETLSTVLQNFLGKIGITIPDSFLPQNLELFIVPTILLVAGAVVLIGFWKASHKRRRS